MLSLLIGYFAIRHLVLILTLEWAKFTFKHKERSWVYKHLQFLLTCLHSSPGGESALCWTALCWWGWSRGLPLIACLYSPPGLDGKQRFQRAKAMVKNLQWVEEWKGWEVLLSACFFTPKTDTGHITVLRCGVRDPDLSCYFAWLRSAIPDYILAVWNFSDDVMAPKPIYSNKTL